MNNLKTLALIVVMAIANNVFAYTDRSGDTSSSLTKRFGDEYMMSALGQTSFDSNKVSHIIVVGTAMGEDSDQFFQTGLLQGYKYKELYPGRQVVIISTPDVIKTDNDEVFKRFNLSIIRSVDAKLNAYNLVSEMLKFKKIASFDFYGHSSPWAVKLGEKSATIEPGSHKSTLQKVIPHFTENAYATLNGCNGGFNLAPELSAVWKIPVSGSLTSTQFERLQKDGYYKKGDRTDSETLSVNSLSFKEPLDCSMGVCWRLKTARKNYSSYWGNFDKGGLSFPKFFCNFDNSDKRCQKSMALSLISFPSVRPITKESSTESFKEVLYDYLCSTSGDKNYFKKCVEGIKKSVLAGTNVFQMHPGNALNCNFKKCDARIACKTKRWRKSGIRAGSCKVVTEINKKPTTLINEYKAFLEGWSLLQ